MRCQQNMDLGLPLHGSSPSRRIVVSLLTNPLKSPLGKGGLEGGPSEELRCKSGIGEATQC